MKQTLFFNNKTAKYVGDVKNGLMHGKGTYTYKDGSIFKGFWEKGIMHGKGTFTNAFYFSNETIDGKYVGEDEGPLTGVFKKGKPQGIFKWKMKSGRSYVGRIIITYSSANRIRLSFNGRGTLKHPGRGGLVQKGIWKEGYLEKGEKSKSAYLNFMNSITWINRVRDKKYYAQYIKKLKKIRFNPDTIYALKELPFKKDRIKLAIKRFIIWAALEENDEFYQKNLPTLEKVFINLANFQNQKTKKVEESSLKIKNLYIKEIKAFNEYIEFCREKYFKYPEKLYSKIREEEKNIKKNK